MKRILITLALLMLAWRGDASAQSWVFTPYSVPGAVVTMATDINDSGVVTGLFQGGPTTSVYGVSSFVLNNGQLTILEFPTARSTTALGINNLGHVVGSYIDSEGHGKGFLWANNQFSTIAYPGSPQSAAYDINDAGTIVGSYYVGSDNFAFKREGGSYLPLNIPNVADRQMGINNAGTIVGIDWDGVSFRLENGRLEHFDFGPALCADCLIWARRITDAGAVVGGYLGPFAQYGQGFYWDPDGFTRLSAPGMVTTEASGINSRGTIVGWMNPTLPQRMAFIATPLFTVDPSPDLVSGAALTSDVNALATKGRGVEGVAADGVSRVLLRIPAHQAGEEISVTLFNDGATPAPSTNEKEDGALGLPAQTAFTDNVVTLTAVDTDKGPFAFAVYRAPVDFARLNGADEAKASRSVSLRIQYSGGSSITQPVQILRPPVVLVHGLWDNWQTWHHLLPFVDGAAKVDSRFSVGRASYDFYVGPLRSTKPYMDLTFPTVRANALGFQYNATAVSAQVTSWIDQFKRGSNPRGIAVAAVQADVVGHSMGGVITRTMALQRTFFSDVTFRKGIVHKLITLDTPHLGSAIAPHLLGSENQCVAKFMKLQENVILESVFLKNGQFISGAVGDLVPGSLALREIAPAGVWRAPTHFVVGIYEDWQALDSSVKPRAMRALCPFAPLADNLTAANWPTLLGDFSDGIVTVRSQASGKSNINAITRFGDVVHSHGPTALGFSLPSIVDNAGLRVMELLNTPVYDTGALFTTEP